MDVKYKKWKSGEGLEEVQARIYTEVSGIPARAEEIGPRNDERGTEASRYAFSKEGEPLAYITSLVSDEALGRIHIGYPWSLPNCPVEVKDKLLSDIITHYKGQETTKQIRTSVVLASKTKDAQIEFFEKRGFVEDEKAYRFAKDYDIVKTSKLELSGSEANLKCKIATDDDLDTLIELTKADPYMSQAFPNDDAYVPYFKDRVLKDGHAVILYDGDKAVAASAPLLFKPDGRLLDGDEDKVIMRFTSLLPGYTYAWSRLLVEVAKEAKKAGLKDYPIRAMFGFLSRGSVVGGMARIEPDFEEVETFFVLRDE